jgi:ABC-2 type transport system ATP-binding protein
VIDSTLSLKNSVGNDVITLSCSKLNVLSRRLEKEGWIKNTKVHDSFLTIGVEKGEEKIPLIIEIARTLDIKIKSISVRKPTLDDVFLYYTGRTIREEEPSLKETSRVYSKRL